MSWASPGSRQATPSAGPCWEGVGPVSRGGPEGRGTVKPNAGPHANGAGLTFPSDGHAGTLRTWDPAPELRVSCTEGRGLQDWWGCRTGVVGGGAPAAAASRTRGTWERSVCSAFPCRARLSHLLSPVNFYAFW